MVEHEHMERPQLLRGLVIPQTMAPRGLVLRVRPLSWAAAAGAGYDEPFRASQIHAWDQTCVRSLKAL